MHDCSEHLAALQEMQRHLDNHSSIVFKRLMGKPGASDHDVARSARDLADELKYGHTKFLSLAQSPSAPTSVQTMSRLPTEAMSRIAGMATNMRGRPAGSTAATSALEAAKNRISQRASAMGGAN